MSPAGPILGWDIGGAHIKAALLDGDRVSTGIRAHPMWTHAAELPSALARLEAELRTSAAGPGAPGPRAPGWRKPARMAVTMTAELADCFRSKREGVAFVLHALRSAFPDAALHVFGSDGAFRGMAQALDEPLRVASANWAATAMLAARHADRALLIDIGSTTTDLTPIVRGRVAALGRTDPERLATGELVYTGAVRTPVSAVTRTVPFRGGRCRTAAERFAQTGDVHLWLGHIDEEDYTGDTPDGRGTAREDVAARLARVVCADAAMMSDEELTAIARHIADVQVRLIAAAIRQVRRRLGACAPRMAAVTGSGAFLARMACERAGLPARELGGVLGRGRSDGATNGMGPNGRELNGAAPAIAVARLLSEAIG